MAPRNAYGDSPMTGAERTSRSRWANRIEELATKLEKMIDDAPNPLPRKISLPKDLTRKLEIFSINESQNVTAERNNWVLKPGNGNQATNKKTALRFIEQFLSCTQTDPTSVSSSQWGHCHVAAYTHTDGAMITTPNRDKGKFGERTWHSRDHIIMFRDLGTGNCIIYISKIRPLFDHISIGHSGVRWDDVSTVCEEKHEVTSSRVAQLVTTDHHMKT